jgi:tight adherence protein B
MKVMRAAILFLLVGASVFLFALLGLSVLSKAYRRYRERYVASAVEDLSDMFLFVEPHQIVVLNLSLMVVLGISSYWLANPLVGALGTATGFFLPSILIHVLRARRIKRFNAQLVDALQIIAGALRAGLTFPQAVEHVVREGSPPLSLEFGLLVKEAKIGLSIDEALSNLANRVRSDDLELVVVSTQISRALGGNMAEMFDNLSGTIRERFRLEGKIDAMTSQGKLQGWVVAAMPLALGVVLNFLRPDLMAPMLRHPFGYALMGAVCVLELLGALWIRRIVQIDV